MEWEMLPQEGLVTVAQLARNLGLRNDHLKKLLERKGIEVIKLSPNAAKGQFVNLKDMATLKKETATRTYKRKPNMK